MSNLPTLKLVFHTHHVEAMSFQSKKSNDRTNTAIIEHTFTTLDGRNVPVKQWLPKDLKSPADYKCPYKAGNVYVVAFSEFKSTFGKIEDAWAREIVEDI